MAPALAQSSCVVETALAPPYGLGDEAGRQPGGSGITMTIDERLFAYRDTVRPEWIDYNGHMNVSYYVMAFDHVTDAFFDHIGALHTYREQFGQTFFCLEMHVTYEREVVAGDPLRFTTQVIGFDAKRLHIFHAMYHGIEGYLAATNDIMLINVDFATRRSGPIAPPVRARLDEVWATHKAIAAPPQVSRRLGLASGRPAAPPAA
jgi:acyl-CoA thioester hydrolase